MNIRHEFPEVAHKPITLQPIGRFYLIEVAGSDGSYFAETPSLTRGKNWSAADGLAELRQHDDALSIFEVIPAEGYVSDVSEDMARAWIAECAGDVGFDPADASTWPQFCTRYLTNDEAEEIVAASRGPRLS